MIWRLIVGWLARRFRILTPQEYLEGRTAGLLLTFDDGFANNWSNALPVLEEDAESGDLLHNDSACRGSNQLVALEEGAGSAIDFQRRVRPARTVRRRFGRDPEGFQEPFTLDGRRPFRLSSTANRVRAG